MSRSTIVRSVTFLSIIALIGAVPFPRGVMQHTPAQPPVKNGPPPPPFHVDAGIYDPFHTNMAQAQWLPGIGCPTNATVNYGSGNQSYTDPACPTGDSKDNQNQGLLLVKTGPTGNYAAALGNINGLPKNLMVTELGFDIRASGHCGAGAPRFDVVTNDNVTHFYGCTYGAPGPTSNAWTRVRFYPSTQSYPGDNGMLTKPVTQIQIVFDEGEDTGPDYSGLAVLDNIDINGVLVGRH